ncbi:MAG: hypothetical protein ABIO02_01680, partial [Patescibacteria group bacterium]
IPSLSRPVSEIRPSFSNNVEGSKEMGKFKTLWSAPRLETNTKPSFTPFKAEISKPLQLINNEKSLSMKEFKPKNFTEIKPLVQMSKPEQKIQEVKQDLKLAANTKEALIKAGFPEAKAQAIVTKTLINSFEKKSLTEAVPKVQLKTETETKAQVEAKTKAQLETKLKTKTEKIVKIAKENKEEEEKKKKSFYFVKDEQAAQAREELTKSVIEELVDNKKQNKKPLLLKGKDIVANLPKTKEELLSAILKVKNLTDKNKKDGGWLMFLKRAKRMSAKSPEKAKEHLQIIASETRPVKISNFHLNKVTAEEVELVHSGDEMDKLIQKELAQELTAA